MDKEKEIEKIAKTIAAKRGYGCCDHCDMSCQSFKCGCIPYEDAEIIYNAEYRHQREVAIEIFEDIERTFNGLLKGDISEIKKLLSVIRNKYLERN